jgi:hypothetical protein
VLTTGTGDGKSLAYIVPVVDHVLWQGSGKGLRATLIYPMNALANSQKGEVHTGPVRGLHRPATQRTLLDERIRTAANAGTGDP